MNEIQKSIFTYNWINRNFLYKNNEQPLSHVSFTQHHRIDHIQVNIKAPQELHVVSPFPHKTQRLQQPIQPIIESIDEEIDSSPHKIRHIESIDDKGEFIDEHRQSRFSDRDELKEMINRVSYPELELSKKDGDLLKKIIQEKNGEETDVRMLKHFSMLKDRDQFNVTSEKEAQNSKRKRRLSESNISSYAEAHNQFSLAEYLNQQQKPIPQRIQKVLQEEAEVQQKERLYVSPLRKSRKNSVHTVHSSSSPSISEQFKRMIVDELDKKKKFPKKKDEKMDEELPDVQMEKIEEERQDQTVNVSDLEIAREKMKEQWCELVKAVGHEIGPDFKEVLVFEKKPTIHEDEKGERDE